MKANYCAELYCLRISWHGGMTLRKAHDAVCGALQEGVDKEGAGIQT